jgi:hypothetical protein
MRPVHYVKNNILLFFPYGLGDKAHDFNPNQAGNMPINRVPSAHKYVFRTWWFKWKAKT